MVRRLIPLQQLIDEAQDQGEDPDTLFVDPDDVCSVEDLEEESQED